MVVIIKDLEGKKGIMETIIKEIVPNPIIMIIIIITIAFKT